MAEVWEARDELLGRPVAVKVLQSHLSGNATFVERFRREAVTAAAVTSPTIVATYDAGADGATAFIVMELVRGKTLRQLLDESGALDVGLAVEVAAQVVDALADAHGAGLVHRDVKPGNVLLEDAGGGTVRVKVADFGIAKARAGLGSDLTQTGTMLGTPKYSSPEQIQGDHEVDERSDLYSLGIVLFEMLTGRVPFDAAADVTVALAHLSEAPPRVRQMRPAVPRRLDDLVYSLLAKDPSERPASALEVRWALLAAARDGVGGAVGVSDRTRRYTRRRPEGWSGRLPEGPRRELEAEDGDAHPGGAVGPLSQRASLAHRWSSDGSRQQRSTRRHQSGAGLVVAAVALAAVVVGSLLVVGKLAPPRSDHPVAIRSVEVYLDVPGFPPDDPEGARYTFGGSHDKRWWTEQYLGPNRAHFGGLYAGEGLAIRLAGRARLVNLAVSSSTIGWSATTYVSDHPVERGQPLEEWGRPVSSRRHVRGSATFDLDGTTGSWVLLWLTDLGPSGRANVAELTVHGSLRGRP